MCTKPHKARFFEMQRAILSFNRNSRLGQVPKSEIQVITLLFNSVMESCRHRQLSMSTKLQVNSMVLHSESQAIPFRAAGFGIYAPCSSFGNLLILTVLYVAISELKWCYQIADTVNNKALSPNCVDFALGVEHPWTVARFFANETYSVW